MDFAIQNLICYRLKLSICSRLIIEVNSALLSPTITNLVSVHNGIINLFILLIL